VQVREDGLSIDQIVLSPQTYLSTAPGKAINDTTILTANLPSLSSTSVSITANPTSGSAPLSVNFTSNVTLTSGYVSVYYWNFGDGQTSSAASPSHIYQTSGNYTASLKITSSTGATASASTLLSVSGSSSSIKLRVMQANIFYGGHGTDDITNLSRDATWIANMNPDVVSLIEVLGGSNDPNSDQLGKTEDGNQLVLLLRSQVPRMRRRRHDSQQMADREHLAILHELSDADSASDS